MAAPPTASTSTRSTATCRHHRRREAVGRCATCNEPLCRDCMNPTGVGFKCGPCTGGKATSSKRSSPQSARPGWLRPAAVAAAVAVVLGVLAANLLDGGGGQDTAAPGGEVTEEAAASGPVERRVQFQGADELDIGATLALPSPDAAPASGVAAVVVIPGFGPTTRDGVSPPGTSADPFYADLARKFTEAGMASLRYDKRGTGQSVLAQDEQLAFDDMATDAAAAVGFLAERSEVDPGRIAVVGHEEGGLVALQLAGTDPRVGSLVLISVPGRPLLEVLTDDFNNSGHEEEVAGLQAVVGGLLAGQGLPAPSELPPFLRNFFPTTQAGYLESLFALDPVAMAGEVDVPALVVRGDAATGISAADTDALVQALGPETEVVVSPEGGPTLQVIAPTAGGDSSDPTSSAHDHGAGAPTVAVERDQGVLAAITEFLATSGA
jgi:pimeloyl-ACP methyl ester carboxylesterase